MLLSKYTEENLRKAVEKINAEIIIRQSCLENKSVKTGEAKCGSADKERARLEYLRSENAIARKVYNQLGSGIIPFTKSSTWMESHEFIAQPARYKTGYRKSIFLVSHRKFWQSYTWATSRNFA